MNNLICRIIRKIEQYLGVLIRFVLSLHKRDKTLIVYGGALDLFIDNAKHLFIINNKTMPMYQHVWLTRDDHVLQRLKAMGFKAVKSNSQEGRLLLFRAGMVVYDNLIDEFANHNLASGAVRFNMWHAVQGVKRIGAIHTDPPEAYIIKSKFQYKFIHRHTYGDYVLAPSKKLINVMSGAFQVPAEDVVVADQPRTHTLFMSSEELENYVMEYETEDGKFMYSILKNEHRQKIIYMPTFRDANPCYIYKAIPDWDAFNEFLLAHDILLFLKVHRVTPLPDGMNYSNIRLLDNALDVYPLLPLFDRLITDYSSIMFEFALMHKPVVVYDYDLDEYTSESRYVFKSFKELLNNLSEARTYNDLTKLILAQDIKPLPLDNYYDCPGDLSGISHFINSKLA